MAMLNPNRSLALKELDIIAYGIAIGNMQSQHNKVVLPRCGVICIYVRES